MDRTGLQGCFSFFRFPFVFSNFFSSQLGLSFVIPHRIPVSST
jgi:hypothetical protein